MWEVEYITEWYLSTTPQYDFSPLKPQKCLNPRGFFHIVGEKSTDLSTGCGEVAGKTWGKVSRRAGSPQDKTRIF
jgi:hypothetical protein